MACYIIFLESFIQVGMKWMVSIPTVLKTIGE